MENRVGSLETLLLSKTDIESLLSIEDILLTVEGVPQTMAIIILMNPKTGFPLAVMDGQFITVMRTGAAAAVAAKYLSPRVQVLSILGSGAVGKATVRSFNKAFLLREIRIYDISENIARNTASMFQEQYGISLTVSPNAAICIDEADVVVTATDADNPLFPIENLKRDALVISLGSFRESPPKLVKTALIGVSSLDIVLAKKAYDAAKGALIRSSFRF